MTSDAFLAHLDQLGIDHHTLEHEPVFTVEEAKQIRGRVEGAHTKNLFLRNKKGAMWLVTCLEDREMTLKQLAVAVGAKQFSFASPERLMQYLGIIPGAVSPFAIINDTSHAVTVVLDSALREIQPLNLHPLDNSRTTTIPTEALERFLTETGHTPAWLDFDSFELI